MYIDTATGASQLIEPEGGRRFEIDVPLCKSLKSDDGSVELRGIATDHKRDVDREIVKASAAPYLLDYLRAAGCFNWNHGRDIIGHVTDADWIDADSAHRRYGRAVEGTAIDISGRLHPLTGRNDPAGLMEAHRLIECRHPLFYSIQGTANSKDALTGEVIPAVIHQIAITPQPRNTNCAAYVMAKSLDGMMSQLAQAAPESEHEKPLVFIAKALEVSGEVPQQGTTGGDALKIEEGRASTRAKMQKCDACGAAINTEGRARFCPDCGKALVQTASGADYVRALGKALAVYAAPQSARATLLRPDSRLRS